MVQSESNTQTGSSVRGNVGDPILIKGGTPFCFGNAPIISTVGGIVMDFIPFSLQFSPKNAP